MSRRCDILLQAALDEELAPVIEALEGVSESYAGPWKYWRGQIAQVDVALWRTDEGPLNAAAASALGIHLLQPRAVINYGIAGAHNPELRKGDIIIGRDAVDYSGFRSTAAGPGEGIDCGRWSPKPHKIRTSPEEVTRLLSFPGDPALVELAMSIPSSGRVLKGRIGSALQFNLEVDRIIWVRNVYETDSEDQESAYCAGVATAMRVPFVAVRAISDSVFNDPVLDKSLGRVAAAFVLELVRAIDRDPVVLTAREGGR